MDFGSHLASNFHQNSLQIHKKCVSEVALKKHMKKIPFIVENRRLQSRKIEQNDGRVVQNHTSRKFSTRLKKCPWDPSFWRGFWIQTRPKINKKGFRNHKAIPWWPQNHTKAAKIGHKSQKSSKLLNFLNWFETRRLLKWPLSTQFLLNDPE